MKIDLVGRCLAAVLSLLLLAVAVPTARADTPPAVTSDPEFRDVAAGTGLVLAPTLTGDALTACQWFKDGVPIAGATSATFSIPSVTAVSAGYYTATFTNAAGSVQAAVAVVQVDGAPVAPDTSASSYRLMDYFYARRQGAQWLYSGVDARNGQTVYTQVTMADLARAVTCYTGRYTPQSLPTTALALDGAYGSYAGGVFTPAQTWTDFMSAGTTGVAMWGDDYAGGESARLDGSFNFPATMRLGQTCERVVDYYERGTFVAPVTMFFQLLSVETVDTPAGRFSGALHTKVVMDAPGDTRTYEEWWVAGLGKVRKKWISGSGPRLDSRLVSSTLPAGTRYLLADYFVSPIAGSVFNSTGFSAGGSVSNTISTITGTDVTITTYHGTGFPATPVNQQVMADQNFSRATDGSLQETWQEYLTIAGGAVIYWGVDNPAAAGPIRFENGAAFPIDMAVGETTTITRNAYLAGFFAGSGSMKVQLLGVENCSVPAGTFANCLHLQFTVAVATQSQSYEMWTAPAVGCVRYKAVAGGGLRERNLVSWAVPSAPALSSQSLLETCPLNGTARLAVMAVGTAPLTFQWYRGNAGDVSTPIAATNSHAFITPALSAWTRYWVRVSNAVGSVDSATMLVMPTDGTMTLADWVLQNELPSNQRGSLNTPAGDNVTNLLKFGLGILPMDSVTPGLPRAVVVPGTGTNRHLGLEFARNSGAQGIRLVLEVSADLITWNEVSSTLETLGAATNGRQNVRLRETAPLGAATRRFARLKVASP